MKPDLMRWTVATEEGDKVIVPQNTYTFKWKLQDNEEFYRLELNGDLLIGGKNRFQDYALLRLINDELDARYEPWSLVCDVMLNGTWKRLWKGTFTGNDMEVDECNCWITLKPEINDDYRCLLDNWDKDFNIIEMENVVSTRSPRFFPYEFFTCRPAGACVPGGEGWSIFFENTDVDDVRIYWREFRIMSCVANEPVPPSGSWTLVDDSCSVNGTAKYVRTPAPASPTPQIVQGHCMEVDGVMTSFPPPNPVEYAVDHDDIASDPPVIAGPRVMYRANYSEVVTVTFRILDPRLGSNYTWSVNSGLSITSGQGSDLIQITLPSTFTFPGFALQVVETPTCEAALAPVSHNVRIIYGNSWRGLNVNMDLEPADMYASTQFADGDTLTVELNYSIPNKPTLWQVDYTGSASNPHIVLTGNIRLVLQDILLTGGDIRVRHGFAPHPDYVGDPIWSDWITIERAVVPDAPAIRGPEQLCPGSYAYYRVPVRSGASYTWSVPEGWVITSVSDGSILVRAGDDPGSVSLTQVLVTDAEWLLISPCSEDGEIAPWYWAFSDDSGIQYGTGRYFVEMIEWLVRRVCPATEEPTLMSDFFQYHPVNPSGTSYVTGAANRLTALTVHSKGDVLHPDFDEPTRRLLLTPRKALEMSRVLFNTRWRYENGKLRLENMRFFAAAEAVDISTLVKCKKYRYEKADLFRMEKFSFTEGENSDFVGLPIVYDRQGSEPRQKSAAVSDKTQEYSPGDVTTDLPFIQNANDSQVDRHGFVVLQNRVVINDTGTTIQVEQENGLLTGMLIPNGHMGWASLHHNYHRDGRMIRKGYMNGQFTTFDSYKRAKQENVEFGMCAADLYAFDPYKRYQTQIGLDPLGEDRPGKVSEAELDFFKEQITIKLQHLP